jgi:hypothetical protein
MIMAKKARPSEAQAKVLEAMRDGHVLMHVHGIRRTYWSWGDAEQKRPLKSVIEAANRAGWITHGEKTNAFCRAYTLTPLGLAALRWRERK